MTDYPEVVKSIPHVAFEVDDLEAELKGKHVIIKPNSPSEGVTVAFIEVIGAPIELMQYHPEELKRCAVTVSMGESGV